MISGPVGAKGSNVSSGKISHRSRFLGGSDDVSAGMDDAAATSVS